MPRILREYRNAAIVLLGLFVVSLIASFWQEFGSALSGFLVQINRCKPDDYKCILLHYAFGFIMIFAIAIFIDITIGRKRKKVKIELRRLIEKGESLYMQSRRSSQYKNRKKEWIPLLKDWDIKEMQPFIEKYYGEDELLVYKSPVKDIFEDDPIDSDYGEWRSILVTRINRAKKLLEKFE